MHIRQPPRSSVSVCGSPYPGEFQCRKSRPRAYKFGPPVAVTHAEVLLEAHLLRTERGDYAIGDEHLADAIKRLTQRTTRSLSPDRGVRDPYAGKVGETADRHVAQRPR